MENKDINAIPEEVAQDIPSTRADINTEEPIEAVGYDDTSDVIDTEGIRQCAEEFEAELLTIAPVGEAPEIPVEKVSTAKKPKKDILPFVIGGMIGAVMIICIIVALLLGGKGSDCYNGLSGLLNSLQSDNETGTGEESGSEGGNGGDTSTDNNGSNNGSNNGGNNSDSGSGNNNGGSNSESGGGSSENSGNDLPQHVHTEVTDAPVSPTCTSTGLTAGVHCSSCGDVLVAQEVVPKKAHIESNWIIDKEATDTEVGLKHTQCTVCGTKISTETIPVSDEPQWLSTYDISEAFDCVLVSRTEVMFNPKYGIRDKIGSFKITNLPIFDYVENQIYECYCDGDTISVKPADNVLWFDYQDFMRIVEAHIINS